MSPQSAQTSPPVRRTRSHGPVSAVDLTGKVPKELRMDVNIDTMFRKARVRKPMHAKNTQRVEIKDEQIEKKGSKSTLPAPNPAAPRVQTTTSANQTRKRVRKDAPETSRKKTKSAGTKHVNQTDREQDASLQQRCGRPANTVTHGPAKQTKPRVSLFLNFNTSTITSGPSINPTRIQMTSRTLADLDTTSSTTTSSPLSVPSPPQPAVPTRSRARKNTTKKTTTMKGRGKKRAASTPETEWVRNVKTPSFNDKVDCSVYDAIDDWTEHGTPIEIEPGFFVYRLPHEHMVEMEKAFRKATAEQCVLENRRTREEADYFAADHETHRPRMGPEPIDLPFPHTDPELFEVYTTAWDKRITIQEYLRPIIRMRLERFHGLKKEDEQWRNHLKRQAARTRKIIDAKYGPTYGARETVPGHIVRQLRLEKGMCVGLNDKRFRARDAAEAAQENDGDDDEDSDGDDTEEDEDQEMSDGQEDEEEDNNEVEDEEEGDSEEVEEEEEGDSEEVADEEEDDSAEEQEGADEEDLYC